MALGPFTQGCPEADGLHSTLLPDRDGIRNLEDRFSPGKRENKGPMPAECEDEGR
jgi:hypothetical protein